MSCTVCDELKAWLEKQKSETIGTEQVIFDETLEKLEELQAREFKPVTAAKSIKELLDKEERERKE